MGSRLYIISWDPARGKWRRVYHHTGASEIYEAIEKGRDVRRVIEALERRALEERKAEYFSRLYDALAHGLDSMIEVNVVRGPRGDVVIFALPLIKSGIGVLVPSSGVVPKKILEAADRAHMFSLFAEEGGMSDKAASRVLAKAIGRMYDGLWVVHKSHPFIDPLEKVMLRTSVRTPKSRSAKTRRRIKAKA